MTAGRRFFRRHAGMRSQFFSCQNAEQARISRRSSFLRRYSFDDFIGPIGNDRIYQGTGRARLSLNVDALSSFINPRASTFSTSTRSFPSNPAGSFWRYAKVLRTRPLRSIPAAVRDRSKLILSLSSRQFSL